MGNAVDAGPRQRGAAAGLMARRILLVHNRYQHVGGEDRVMEAEAELLRSYGHQVFYYNETNDRILQIGKIQAAVQTIWSHTSYRKLLKLIREERIELCHFHNTFPLISPSAYYAARRAGVPVVQTLHNYRIMCASALLMREGKICEDCLGRVIAWPGAVRRCYRNSYSASAVTAAMISTHRMAGTWTRAVDRYIALTQFARGRFIKGGLPAEKIAVKPNFAYQDPGTGDGGGGYALFVGRLSPEKGLDTILKAWDMLPEAPPLRIAGGGPLAPQVKDAAARNPKVQWLGELPKADIQAQMKGAKFLVCASTWYENFPVIIVEAFSVGLPIIASDIGVLPELIGHERTGLLFRTGDSADLCRKIQWALHHPSEFAGMRIQARSQYESNYTADTNYRALMTIYEDSWRLVPERARLQPKGVMDLQ
jgi:glycosyltransferase involved in cell wall biosynthesis